MNMPYVSIIVPVYNAEKTLRQCVNSILGQDFCNYELLLVDDGSSDSSSSICDDYAKQDSRICVFHKKNGGVSSARNVGLENAKGHWITFVDADDLISADYLNGLEDKEEELLIKGYAELNPKSEKIGRKFIPLNEDLPKLGSYLAQSINSFTMRGPICKFYRRELLNEKRFHEDMKVGEDTCFVMDYLSSVKSVRILAEGYYIVRWHVEAVTARYKLSLENAKTHLSHLFLSYKTLNRRHSIGRSKFFYFIGFYKASSKDDWKQTPWKWYLDKDILKMYRYVWPDLSLKQKVNLLGAFILKR